MKKISFTCTEISDYSFFGCSSAADVSLGSSNVVRIGNSAFSGCALVSKFNSTEACKAVIPEACREIGGNALDGMGLMTSLTVPDSVTSIGSGAFRGFSALESVSLPFVGRSEKETYGDSRTFGYVFGRVQGSYDDRNNKTSGGGTTCLGDYNYVYSIPTLLTEVTITRQTAIPANAFYNCDCIRTIHLVNCIDTIGDKAFYECNATVIRDIIPTFTSWDGKTGATEYYGGTGTESDPYQIYKAKEFIYFLNQIKNGETYDGVYFELVTNISLGGYSITPTALNESTAFKGILNGKGHKIFNFKIDYTGNAYNGIFGFVDGTIKNIGFESTITINTSLANDVYVGMIVGKLSGTLENVYAIGTLTSTSLKASYVGGLVGFNNGTVINSYSDVNIVATSKGSNCFAAGLIGYNNENVSGCFVHGNVSAKGYLESYSFASGLIAAEGETSKVTSCFRYNGQIITKYSSISTSFTNIGTESTLDNIISYCKTNWDNTIWSFEKTLPVFKR